MGPGPVRYDSASAALTGPRSRVLEWLQQSEGSVTATALAHDIGMHVNTVREHLEGLVQRGLATREMTPPTHRGRPAWRYFPALDASEPDPRVRDYAALTSALAGQIARSSADPENDAIAAGLEWGRILTPGRGPVGAPSARQGVINLLSGLGFDPVADSSRSKVRLRRCPLLDAARQQPEIVCAAHLGMVRGVLEALGGDASQTELTPFAEVGACLLTLRGSEKPLQ